MDEDVVQTIGTPEMMNKEDVNHPGGDSTRKAMASKSKEKEIPRYLRASTGSCHDLCKYGKRHISEEKPWRSTTTKTFKKALDDDLNVTSKAGSSNMKNKVMVTKKKTVNDDSSEVNKREAVKHQVSGGSNEMKKPEVLIISSGDEIPVKQIKKKTTLSFKLKPSPNSGSYSSGTVDSLKPKVFKKSYPALATSKSKVNKEQVASPKPKMGKLSGGKDGDTKTKKTAASSRVVSKKVPVTPRASLSPRLSVRRAGNSSLRKSQSSKASSSVSQQNGRPKLGNCTDESNEQSDGYPVEEKTLHVVEMETTSKFVSEYDQNKQSLIETSIPPLLPTQSTEQDDECTVSETEEFEYSSGSSEVESVEDVDGMSNGEKKPRETRKEGDSADEAARKLHFRRGKVVDADTVGKSARKLKFRKGKGLGEDKAQAAERRLSFKKRENISEEEEVDENGEKVVLRHQDVQEKDAQGLFNNVIEETASKLVESRKSKVKALVGAFETVISLQ